jgi:hypothetical protein
MTNELTTTNNQELIQEARGNMGQRRNKIPFVPTLSINNKKETVVIDGEKLEKQPKQGFNLTVQDENGKHETSYFLEELEGVVLKIRYSIQSKMKVEPGYYSFEFDDFRQPIAVYDKSGSRIIEAPYREIKEYFKTGELNSMGAPKKSFNLNYILYLNYSGEIFRLRLNNASISNFIDYVQSFGENDVITAYNTRFKLEFNEDGTIKFWLVNFEKGSMVNLTEQIELQKTLNETLNLFSNIQEQNVESKPKTFEEQKENFAKQVDILAEEKLEEQESVDISQIPF